MQQTLQSMRYLPQWLSVTMTLGSDLVKDKILHKCRAEPSTTNTGHMYCSVEASCKPSVGWFQA